MQTLTRVVQIMEKKSQEVSVVKYAMQRVPPDVGRSSGYISGKW